MTSHFAGCFSVSLGCLSTLLKSPVVIRSSHSHLAVISAISVSSQSHLTVISEPSRSHLAVISEPSHSHLAVLSHSSHKNQVQSWQGKPTTSRTNVLHLGHSSTGDVGRKFRSTHVQSIRSFRISRHPISEDGPSKAPAVETVTKTATFYQIT